MKSVKKISGCITFFGHDIVNVYCAKCNSRCSRKRRASEEASNDELDDTPRTFACGGFLEIENHRVGLEGVLVEQDSRVRVASIRKELIRDVRNMITGFLKNNGRELSTGRRDNVIRIPARRTRIPLKEKNDDIDDA